MKSMLNSFPTPVLCGAVLALKCCNLIAADPTFTDANWTSMGGFPGVNGTVRATVSDASGNLYVGGSFNLAGNIFATNIASWDGNRWSGLGSGTFGAVYALAVSGGDMYVGGEFIRAGGNPATNIAKWNGNSWASLGSVIGGSVRALARSGGELYVGGSFTNAGGVPASRVARWDESNWWPLGAGVNGDVHALLVSAGDVYVGGAFSRATNGNGTTVEAVNIAKWSGDSWSAIGSGRPHPVYALALLGGELYAGTAGGFSGYPAPYVAKWNGSAWSVLYGLNAPYIFLGQGGGVYALAEWGGELYAGGHFTTAGSNSGKDIAKWNGDTWTAVESGMRAPPPPYPGHSGTDGIVYALTPSGGNLFAGGYFRSAGGNPADHTSRWDGTNWSALAAGLSGGVRALAFLGDDLFAGGYFSTEKGSGAKSIAKRHGGQWIFTVSQKIDAVQAFAVWEGELYAGGTSATYSSECSACQNYCPDSNDPEACLANCASTVCSPLEVNYVARWNGTGWTAIGSELSGNVSALAGSGSNLYAATRIATNSSPLNCIVNWNGSSWSNIGSELNRDVYSLAVSGSNLFAAGQFTIATNTGGAPITVNRIARWDGSNWWPLGLGLDRTAYAIAVSGSNLYVGGEFTMAGNAGANRIARWNGQTWSALGTGLNNEVYALAVSGNDLYVAGSFTTAGGQTARGIAKWNGSTWTPLGSGMDSDVRALLVSGKDLYAGGWFLTAGGKVSPFIARAYLGKLPKLSVLRSGPEVKFFWPVTDTEDFALEQADALENWQASFAAVTDDGTNRSVTIPTTNTAQFFRLRRP